MTKAYLAGPMRSKPNFNFNAFEETAKTLREGGIDIVSPHEIDIAEGLVKVERYENGVFKSVKLTKKFTIEGALKRDFAAILKCDAVIMLPGWEGSSGANAERSLANQIGLPVWEFMDVDPETGEPALREIPTDYAPPLRLVGNPTEEVPTSVGNHTVNESGEVRITDPETGGQKGQKLAQLGAMDPRAIMRVAEAAGFGTKKYERYNFAKGYAWSLSYDALQRHLHAFWAGEDRDSESGLYHLAHAGWHVLTLLSFLGHGSGTDDRFPNPYPRSDGAA
jgi:nucleoside 2-deoxyribosyltransferase